MFKLISIEETKKNDEENPATFAPPPENISNTWNCLSHFLLAAHELRWIESSSRVEKKDVENFRQNTKQST